MRDTGQMLHSTDAIRTTHVGSLPRTDALLTANTELAEQGRTPAFDRLLTDSVTDLVHRQVETGISQVGDGEYGHAMSHSVDYGAWWNYSFARLGGLEPSGLDRWADTSVRRSGPGNVVLTTFPDRRDRRAFAEAYSDPDSGILTGRRRALQPKVTGPLTYTGQQAVAADIANLQAAMAAAGADEGFIPSLSPGSCSRIANEYYATEEEFVYACADAMREEYRAILDAGLVLQIDDPSIAENWDMINPEPTVADYQAFTRVRIEALQSALRGLDTSRVRFHVCWGSWHGPHTTDIGFEHLVDMMLSVEVGGYSFEAGNVRHEHEWRVWQDRVLPDGAVILPGVVSHATNVVEHPRLVADRIVRFAGLVGKENVVASTDCGLGGRVHPQIAWAKLAALTAGAALASAELY